MIIFLILVLLTILVNLAVLFLIYKNNKRDSECENFDLWKKEFIKYYAIISLVIIFIIYIIPLLLRIFNQKLLGIPLAKFIKSSPMYFILSIFIAVGFFNLYFIFRYTKELRNSKCNCDDEIEKYVRDFLYFYSMVVIIIYILTTLTSISLSLK